MLIISGHTSLWIDVAFCAILWICVRQLVCCVCLQAETQKRNKERARRLWVEANKRKWEWGKRSWSEQSNQKNCLWSSLLIEESPLLVIRGHYSFAGWCRYSCDLVVVSLCSTLCLYTAGLIFLFRAVQCASLLVSLETSSTQCSSALAIWNNKRSTNKRQTIKQKR